MAVPPANRLARVVADIDPSRQGRGTDASPGVITEAEKPQARAALDAMISQYRSRERMLPEAGRRYLGDMQTLLRALDGPGDFDARSSLYRRAQERGLPVTQIDSRTSPDYHLSPEELRGAIDTSIEQAAALDTRVREARSRQPPDEAQLRGLETQLQAAVGQVRELRQSRILSLVDGINLPEGTHVDVDSPTGLPVLRDVLDNQVARWSNHRNPEVIDLLSRDPAELAAYQRRLADARSEISMTMGGPDALAQALFNATWGRPGTDERAAQVTLAQIFATGTQRETDAELTRLLHVHGVDVPEGGDSPAIRHTIASEMSWIDRRVAESMFATGRDSTNTADWEYFLHGLTKPFDSAFDWAVDNPGGAMAAAGGAVVAGATLPLSVLAAAGLGFGLYETGSGAIQWTNATTPEERTDAIYRTAAGVTVLAPAVGTGVRLMRSGQAIRGGLTARPLAEGELPNGIDPRTPITRITRRVLGSMGRHIDEGRFEFAPDPPRRVYRASYYAPNGRVGYYATTDYNTALAFQRSQPGSMLYVGSAVEGSEAQVVGGAGRTGRAFLAHDYRWAVASSELNPR